MAQPPSRPRFIPSSWPRAMSSAARELRALLILELGQAVVGGLLVAGVIRLAREIAPGRPLVSLAAGIIAALHPTLVYAATHVQVALLAATLLTWTQALGYRVGRTGTRALLTGILLGLLILTDPILGLVWIGVNWAIIIGRGMRESVRPMGIVAMTAVVAILPWIIRNGRVHGEFVAVKSSFGYAFWQGNCQQSEGTDKVVRPSVARALERESSSNLRAINNSLWEARHEAGYLDDIVLTSEDYQQLGSVSEPERSRILFRRALADLGADPGRYLELCFRRLRYFVLFDETNPKTRSLIYRIPHLGLTFLAILGLACSTPDVRRKLGPTIATSLLIAAFHALTIVSARFHIPIEPLMAVWAGCGFTRVGERIRSETRVTTMKPMRKDTAQSMSRSSESAVFVSR